MSFITGFFLTVLFLAVSELFLLIRVSTHIGFFWTFMLCVLTGIAGGSMVRYQGLKTLARVQGELRSGHLPAIELIEGIVLIIIGALLCVPGFITDVFGFVMLIPPVRKKTAVWLKKRFSTRVTFRSGGSFQTGEFHGGERSSEYEEGAWHPPFEEDGRRIIDVDFKNPPSEEDQ